MAPKISPDDLNLLYDGGNESVVDIVFVHGLRGHPRKTWEAQDPENPDELVFWPQDLLPETIKNSRIFSFGYATQFVTFYGINTEPINHTSIDHHSASLILKFGNVRRDTQTPTRPIIFVAHSLGGLVVANSLVGKYGTDAQGQEVINHTYGTVFFGTPFKSSDKAPVAEIARKVLKMFGDTNDQTIRDLDKRSEKLQKISNDFHSLLEERLSSNDLKPIQVACFFEEIKTTRTFFKVFEKDLGHIVTADSATLAGCKQFGINATHQMMCRFSNVENAGYKLVTGKIKEMISNFNKSKAQLKEEGKTVIIVENVTQKDIFNIQGINHNVLINDKENGVNLTVDNRGGDNSAMFQALLKQWSERKESEK